MDDEETTLLEILLFRRRQRKERRVYVRKLNRRRQENGEFNTLVKEMTIQHDDEIFFRYFRMTPARFDSLLEKVAPVIAHAATHESPVSCRERLSVTLRILASGNSQQSVADSYKLGKSTVHSIFYETCNAIWTVLHGDYVQFPTAEKWLEISHEFMIRWNFPMCVGAIDGKHVCIKAPSSSGSLYFNYKGRYSVVLLAVVDAQYRFIYIDVGAYGRESDGGIFSESNFGRRMNSNTLNLPEKAYIPGTDVESPFVFVGDEAFPLKPNLMRPYPGNYILNSQQHEVPNLNSNSLSLSGLRLSQEKRVYNYRLSRARRIVENAFGILSARWRIFRKPMEMNPTNVDIVIKATIALHNFLKTTDITNAPNTRYVPPSFVDTMDHEGEIRPGAWRSHVDENETGMRETGRLSTNTSSQSAMRIRENFTNFFASPAGSVPWQNSVVNRGSLPHS